MINTNHVYEFVYFATSTTIFLMLKLNEVINIEMLSIHISLKQWILTPPLAMIYLTINYTVMHMVCTLLHAVQFNIFLRRTDRTIDWQLM